ncbi:MAG TPA: hypothetical protein VMU25_01720 [Candidatus Paceibacterota bacterium]|nr:hypothetical protein [Candidatus Paceibacterota bacterium]
MKGGKRAGAGRKKGYAAVRAEEARRQLAEMVSSEIGPIGKALIAKAKSGDTAAARELFDRAWGRASQSVDVTSQGEHVSGLGDTNLVVIAERVAAELAELRLK